MDKRSLAEWGWIIVIVLILAFVIAFASPFGTFIVTSVKGFLVNLGQVGDYNANGLAAPKNLNVIDEQFSFDSVYKATGYTITVAGGEPFDTENTSVDISDKLVGLAGSVEIEVNAFNDEEISPTAKYTYLVPGLYETGSNYTVLLKSWKELINEGVVHVDNGVVYTNFEIPGYSTFIALPNFNSSSSLLTGDLLLPHDGTILSIGSLDADTMTGEPGFAYCYELTGIKIPSSVKTICDSAFSTCVSLADIYIPSSVTYIGISAFADCVALQSVDVQASISAIPESAFNGCTSLNSVSMSENISVIGDSSFARTGFTTLTLPDTVSTIKETAFAACKNLTEIYIPNSILALEGNPFANCANLNKITVEAGNAKYYSKNNCLIEISSKKLVASGKTCDIPSDGSVLIIGIVSCSNNPTITNITIPEGVLIIESSAFVSCPMLNSITIPSSVTKIENNILGSCGALAKINYNGTIEQWNALNVDTNWYNVGEYTIYCTNGTIAKDGTTTPNS